MNKKYFLKELKDYCSIFISFVVLLILFSNNMTFATTCEQIKPRASLDHCDTYEINYSKDVSKIDKDGNQPAMCKSVSLEYSPYTSPDYYYDSRNKHCLIWAITISLTYAAASLAANAVCNKFTEVIGVSPTDAAEQFKKGSDITKKMFDLRVILKTLNTSKGAIISAGSVVGTSALMDPIIILQLAYAADAAVLGFYTGYNIVKCHHWTPLAAIQPVNPVAVLNATGACSFAIACGVALATLTALSQTLIFASTGIIYDSAKSQINRAKLCGHDWEGRVFTEYDVENFDSRELYPQTGFFSNSYSYKLKKCFEYGETKARNDYGVDCAETIEGDGFCELDSSFCQGLTMQSRTMKNRLYREILYNGKEFEIDIDYGSGKCIDPRPDIQKGFTGLGQRYYFRGSNSAQYACKRFKYKNQGCILADNTKISVKEAENDHSLDSKCRQIFEDAFNCCKSRAALGVCVYDTEEDEDFTDSSTGRKPDHNTMCLRSLESDSSPDSCSLKFKNERDPEFIAFTSQEDSMKICIRNVNYCPYTYNLAGGTAVENLYCNGEYSCEGAIPEDDIDSGDRFTIPSKEDKERIWSNSKPKYPTNAYGETKNYCSYNAHCTEIGDTGDSDFQDMTDNKFLPRVCSDFIGDSQNLPVPISLLNLSIYDTIKKAFAEGGVDISKPNVDSQINNLTDEQVAYIYVGVNGVGLAATVITAAMGAPFVAIIMAATIVTPQVINAIKANGNSRNTLKEIVATINKPLISGIDFNLGEYRGFTAPIVQCFKETLYNMFNNKAGQSFCKNETEQINSEGLCGNDTFGPPQSINPDKYYYIIGQDLPEDSNIFYKLQSRLQFIIKMAAIFAIIMIGLNFLLKGEFNIFDDPKKPKAMVVELMKFAIVFYFAVGNAWQSQFYKWIDDASGYLYYKVFDLSLLGYGGYKNIDYEVVCKKIITTKSCSDQVVLLQNTTFNENGAFTISPNATHVKLEVWGGGGGNNGTETYGRGGYSFGTIELPITALNLGAGSILHVKIGASGGTSKAGGGATDIRLSNTLPLTCNTANDPRIIVAGGAGGTGTGIEKYANDRRAGGAGGGGNNSGNNGISFDLEAYGRGGTLSAGGIAGSHSGYSGTSGVCGNGGIGHGGFDDGYRIYGDGGNGWYGGGGASGGWSAGSGGGGSGYVNSYLVDKGGSNGINNGNGYAKIASYRHAEECYFNYDVNNNFIVADLTIFPGGNMPTSKYCTVNDGTGAETCYSDCVKREKKDSSGNKNYIWKDTYDGCYFGDAYYPQGKRYLAIFDSLDCKLMNYFNYTPGTNLPGILHMLLLSILWSPLALIVVCLGFIFFIILLSIVIKIFYMFLMSLFAVNLLIYISPLIFPSLLFKRYKNMFTTWLDSLMGYILQVVFIVIFAGLVIGNMEKLGLGDAKYIGHDPATGRLPRLDCSSSDISLLCIFNVNTSKGEQPAFGTKIYKFFGIGPLVAVGKSINNNFVGTVITLIKACLILYVLLQFLKKIPDFALDLAGVKTLLDPNSKLEPGNMMKELKDKTEIAMKAMKYSGISMGKGIKKGATKLGEVRREFKELQAEKKEAQEQLKESRSPKKASGSSGSSGGSSSSGNSGDSSSGGDSGSSSAASTPPPASTDGSGSAT